MSCNSPLSGFGLPNVTDPCVCNALQGTSYVDLSTSKVYFRVTLSNPCLVSDWVDLCTLCPTSNIASGINFDDSLIPCLNPFNINGSNVEEIIHSIICKTPIIMNVNLGTNQITLSSPDGTNIQTQNLPTPLASLMASNITFDTSGFPCSSTISIFGSLQDIITRIICKFPTNITVDRSIPNVTISSQDGTYVQTQLLPTVTVTNTQNLTSTTPHRITITNSPTGQTLNIPAPIIAHRRRSVAVEGTTFVPANTYTNTTNFNDIRIDTTGGVALSGPNNALIIPRNGYYWIECRGSYPALTLGNVIGVALLVNGSTFQQTYIPTNGITAQQVETHFSGNLNINDQVTMQLFSTIAVNALSLDLYYELKH